MFQLVYCVGGSLKNVCHFEMGGLANADVIRGGRSMLTVADRGRGVKFAKILLTSYVNASLPHLSEVLPQALQSLYNRFSQHATKFILNKIKIKQKNNPLLICY